MKSHIQRFTLPHLSFELRGAINFEKFRIKWKLDLTSGPWGMTSEIWSVLWTPRTFLISIQSCHNILLVLIHVIICLSNSVHYLSISRCVVFPSFYSCPKYSFLNFRVQTRRPWRQLLESLGRSLLQTKASCLHLP